MKFQIGKRYSYSVSTQPDAIKRVLVCTDQPDTWRFYRANEEPSKEYGTLALVGDTENNNMFAWCSVAAKENVTEV